MERFSIHGFKNREDAGRQLASRLRHFAEDDDCILLALPRGGVPVASEIGRILNRPIGLVYLPQSERRSHYFDACMPRQFDAVIHFDHTRAVEPLECTAGWKTDEAQETFPVGL